MILSTQTNGNALVAVIEKKEANLTVADAFKTELTDLIEKGERFIIVDFSKVIYVDSSFLGALVSALKQAIATKADIVVAGLNKDILGLFQLIRLDKAFKIFDDAEQAAKSK